ALREWTGEDKAYIKTIGNGRKWIIGDADITRTIGDFTASYPILLSMDYYDDIPRQVKWITDMVRSIPKGGMSFEILKEVTYEKDREYLAPYLGRADIFLSYHGEHIEEEAVHEVQPLVTFSDLLYKEVHEYADENEKCIENFGIDMYINSKGLEIKINYVKDEYIEETVEHLCNLLRKDMLRIIEGNVNPYV
ncbi:MAG: condensation domain-containing protein, partial [Bacillota bacterium]